MAAPAVLVLTVSVAACVPDESGPPRDASVEAFCAAYFDLFSGAMHEIDPAASAREQEQEQVAALRAWAEELAEVGTPADMPEEARQGFELVIGAARTLDDDAVDNLAELGDRFTERERASTGALEQYATRSCESPFGDPPVL
jgi:hypothetical protein